MSGDLFNPAQWLRLWALYCHMNERCRAEYDRGTPHRPFLPWNEQVLLRRYAQAGHWRKVA